MNTWLPLLILNSYDVTTHLLPLCASLLHCLCVVLVWTIAGAPVLRLLTFCQATQQSPAMAFNMLQNVRNVQSTLQTILYHVTLWFIMFYYPSLWSQSSTILQKFPLWYNNVPQRYNNVPTSMSSCTSSWPSAQNSYRSAQLVSIIVAWYFGMFGKTSIPLTKEL